MKGIEQFLQVDAATLGALKYAGTWNASTNTPTLASGVGVQGQYYVVSVAGSTNLDGETNWQVGDWAVFNGSVWQKVDGGSTGLLTTLTVTGNTYLATTSGNVGIGTTSPAAKLGVTGNAVFSGGVGGTPFIAFSEDQAGGTPAYWQWDATTGLSTFYTTNASSANGTFNWLTAGAERMRITSAGDVGIGTSSPAAKLDVVGSLGIRVNEDAAGTKVIQIRSNYAGLGPSIQVSTADPLLFLTSNAERMRIDSSGNVGIGTSSPGYKLTVAGASGSAVVSLLETGVRSWGIRAGGVTTNTFDIADFTAGVSRLTLDASGNLGLGVTPNAWVANAKALQIGVFPALWQGSNGATQIGFGVYEGGINTYNYSTTGDLPTMYRQLTGAHAWYTAGAGTAGNAISFTQAMTLDASGNLGVGTSSPGARLHINSGGVDEVARFEGSGEPFISLYDNGVRDFYLFDSTEIRLWGQANKAMVFATNNNERARIPAAGGMVVGTAAIATNATDGFLYVPTCAGTPTGTPTTQTGTAPIVIDTTNNKLYFYSGGAWRDAGP